MSVILAIESAIAGGSLSLIRDGAELANWTGRSDVSKAEELLIEIDAMLTACSVSKHDIDLIGVSAGPGSFTGIRIGIATAMGLKAGLGIPMTSVSALEAICRTADSLPELVETQSKHVGPLRSDVIIAVPVGRTSVCIQSFQAGENEIMATTEPRTIPDAEITRLTDIPVVMPSALFEKYSGLPNAVDFGANIAYAVGQMAAEIPGTTTEPLFISKSF